MDGEISSIKEQEILYLTRLEARLFNETFLRPTNYSLYKSGEGLVSILYGSTSIYSYHFNLVLEQLNNTQLVIFVCGNDLCAFKVPTAFLMKLISDIEHQDRLKMTITYDEPSDGWYLIFNKYKPNQILIQINQFHHDLHLAEEVHALSLAVKKMLS